MRKSRFSEEQIIAILREQESGQATKDVCRRHGISAATFYKWNSSLATDPMRLRRRPRAFSIVKARVTRTVHFADDHVPAQILLLYQLRLQGEI